HSALLSNQPARGRSTIANNVIKRTRNSLVQLFLNFFRCSLNKLLIFVIKNLAFILWVLGKIFLSEPNSSGLCIQGSDVLSLCDTGAFLFRIPFISVSLDVSVPLPDVSMEAEVRSVITSWATHFNRPILLKYRSIIA